MCPCKSTIVTSKLSWPTVNTGQAMFFSLLGKPGPGRSMKAATALPRLIILHHSTGTALSDKSKRPFVNLFPNPWFKPTFINPKWGAREKYKSYISSSIICWGWRSQFHHPAHPHPYHPTPLPSQALFHPTAFWLVKKNPLSLFLKHWEGGVIVDKCEAWTTSKLFF